MRCVDMGIVFFFSSRRRHTRWTGDWSSDVCSSDLRVQAVCEIWKVREVQDLVLRIVQRNAVEREVDARLVDSAKADVAVAPRSEERRVGKECRSRWRRGH